MSDRPIEELKAGDDFRRSVVPRADSDFSGAPLWHGWVIMDAFLAGIDWARSRSPGEAHIEAAAAALYGDGWETKATTANRKYCREKAAAMFAAAAAN